MKQLFLIGSFLALLTVDTLAAPADNLTPEAKTPEATALFKVINAKPNDQKWRTAFASALQRYCESVLAQVPRNTPQEDRWLDEQNRLLSSEAKEPPSLATATPEERLASSAQRLTRSDQRMSAIMASPENARKTLVAFFSNCSSLAKKLNEPGAKSSAATILLWVRLSGSFSWGDEFIWRAADIVGLVSQSDCERQRASLTRILTTGSFMGEVLNYPDKNELCRLNFLSSPIHLNIVIPLLEAEVQTASKNKLAPDQPPPAQTLNSQRPGPGWFKQGAGQEEFQRTRARCLMNAEMAAGGMNEGGRWALILTACMRSEGWTRQ